MLSSNKEGGDVFFDACDSIRTSISSSEDSIFENEELEFRNFGYQLWTRELTSVQERRDKFLQEMGFYEPVSAPSGHSQDPKEATDVSSKEHMDLARVTNLLFPDDRVHIDSLPSPDDGGHRDSVCCIRDLDSGKTFIVCDLGQDGLFSTLKEVGSDKLMTLQEFEALLGLSCSVQKVIRRDAASFGEKPDDFNKKKFKSWWRSFSNRRPAAGMCKSNVSVKNPKMRSMRTRVQQHKKRSMEFTALYMGQEIKAHKGLIGAMKFCPSGCYLASGGEDFKDMKLHFSKKCSNSASVIIPKKVFKIEEAPLQEFYGHTGDILDLSWSKSDCLLTSSKDKTVRMWKVGCNGCLKVFRHNDYVTCVQFNPIDNKYFISGSIDGKVRIWGVPENRVVDWVDLRDIVTAICYRPDGKGFVVGCITGNCRFYNYSGQNMQLDSQLCIQGKKKSAGKRITSLQFSPKDSQRVMVTAGDAKVRIVDGFDVIHKFKGGVWFECSFFKKF
ncbi:WD repeat-containing protein 44-like [Cocos nucifera]|uniref:WD repeat-containing protein 44-like n=1 Tax=Cocos nucifera TaxID=13894 RepID=A0A8K0IWL2_COCNU|nr:WD repeat-containing protein 44-like [Cocos nucifera]